MSNPQITRFENAEDEFYSADGHVYGTWGLVCDGRPVAVVPGHVGVDAPREELGEFWVEEPQPGGDRFIARHFDEDELVVTDLPIVDGERRPDARVRFFAEAEEGK